jgi:hypothetical protein
MEERFWLTTSYPVCVCVCVCVCVDAKGSAYGCEGVGNGWFPCHTQRVARHFLRLGTGTVRYRPWCCTTYQYPRKGKLLLFSWVSIVYKIVAVRFKLQGL